MLKNLELLSAPEPALLMTTPPPVTGTLTRISVQLEEFSHQLLELGAHFTRCGARRHGQVVQPRVL